MLMLLLLLTLHPVNVQSLCLGVAECSCEPGPDGTDQVINCRNRDLTSVPTFDLTRAQTRYAELTLAGNRIESIPARPFAGLQFQRLDLTDNPLLQLDPSSFFGLERELTELRLTLDQNAEFPATAISRLTRLRILHVVGFGSRQLPPGALSALSQLAELHLTSGSLATLAINDLNAQRGSLQTLVLYGNEFSAIPTVALSKATMLTSLDLSGNQIPSLPADVFAGLVNLDVVDLSNNGLGGGGLDGAAFRSVSAQLRSLTMKSCQLGDRDMEALRQLHVISELTLSYNTIANLPSTLFNRMRSLRQLRLDNNRLQTVTRSTFSSTSSTLEVLDLSHNPLSGVPEDALLDLRYLQELRLDGVTTIQLGAASFSSQHRKVLRTLSIRGSGIGERLWPIVSSVEGLSSLLASGCSISSIPDFAFQRNTALQTIDLGSNTISSLSQRSVYGLEGSLRAINLHENNIATVHQCTFHGFSTSFDYFKLGLGANPLRCDCDIRWLHSLLRSADAFRLSGLPWTCDDGRRFAQLSDADFASCPQHQANCSAVTPPSDGMETDQSGNSTETGKLSLVLQAYNLSDTECLLEWSVYSADADDIDRFTITREVVQGSTPATSISLPGVTRRYRLTDLQPATEYTVCITMERSEHTSTWTHVCTSVWTNVAPDQPQHDEYRRLLIIILASIFGGTVLIAAVAIAVALLRRYCTSRSKKTAASNFNNTADARTVTDRPRVVYGSKRFAKERGGASVDKPRTVTSEANDQGERVSAAFTPQERATILAMIADTRVAGGPRAYANAAYDRGSSVFAGEANGHVYDAIPGDQFFDEPLDSPV